MVEIVDVEDFQIQVFLDGVGSCPDAPVAWHGIPVVFTLADDGVGLLGEHP